jgi:hypothetical protein
MRIFVSHQLAYDVTRHISGFEVSLTVVYQAWKASVVVRQDRPWLHETLA